MVLCSDGTENMFSLVHFPCYPIEGFGILLPFSSASSFETFSDYFAAVLHDQYIMVADGNVLAINFILGKFFLFVLGTLLDDKA